MIKEGLERQHTFTVSAISREVVKPVIALARERTKRVCARGLLVTVVLVAEAFIKIYQNRSSLFDNADRLVLMAYTGVICSVLEITNVAMQ